MLAHLERKKERESSEIEREYEQQISKDGEIARKRRRKSKGEREKSACELKGENKNKP